MNDFKISDEPAPAAYLSFHQPVQPNHLTFSGKRGRVVDIDLDTGEVTLYTTPTEAALQFWEAVELMYPHKHNNKE